MFLPLKSTYNPKKKRIKPCPISPNITPNKKGKLTIANIAGFNSYFVKKFCFLLKIINII